VLLLVGFVVLAFSVLSSIPDQKHLMTPVVVTGTPGFAPDVETHVAAADPATGQAIFTMYACAGCHKAEDSAGPALTGMGQRAATRRPGYSAAAYLYEAITEPNAYVVPGFPAGVMLQNFKAAIPESDLYRLIAWLETQ
jgi:cytochrome c2